MKYVFLSVAFIGWTAVTVVAALTMIGLVFLLATPWFNFPKQLIDKL